MAPRPVRRAPVKSKETSMNEEQKCENCSAEFTVMEKDDVATALFCPFCGEEVEEKEDLTGAEDWDDQDNGNFG